ncbi:hypothetical protein [Streptomyces sp. LUP30]|uniref:hypothetical protein n=1 Tax=Streptomyces sp. LUP30 TaxID=1890285 RepID=UPI000851E247|nr:hypothetical protein [Streptomyces sp. LUP30]
MALGKTVGGVVAAALLTIGIGATTAGPAAAADGRKCMTFYTPAVSGYRASAYVCWNWTSDGHGAYNGVIDAEWNDQSRTNGIMYLQARVSPNTWRATGDAGYEVAVGTHDHTPYSGLKNLAFRACLPRGCGSS